jgi:hypothetical protein
MPEMIAGIVVSAVYLCIIVLWVCQRCYPASWKQCQARIAAPAPENSWGKRHPKLAQGIAIGIYAMACASVVYFWVTDPHSHHTMMGAGLFVLYRGIMRAVKRAKGGGAHSGVAPKEASHEIA